MQLLEPEEYYQLMAFYMIAQQAQAEVRKYEKAISSLLVDKSLIEKVNDNIYDPSSNGSKRELDDLILSSGVSIKWKETQTKFAKQTEEKDMADVG